MMMAFVVFPLIETIWDSGCPFASLGGGLGKTVNVCVLRSPFGTAS